eukprot:scaffold30825_cov21-Tisochrysis_lutea.AAC.1
MHRLKSVDPLKVASLLPMQERAIKKLKALGGGFELVRIGGSKYARSVPGELNMDKNEVLGVAQVHSFVINGANVMPGKQTQESNV